MSPKAKNTKKNQLLLSKAKKAYRENRIEEAIRIFEKVLARDKNNADALHWLGMAYYKSGDLDKAESLVRQANRLQPSKAEILNNLGNILLGKNNPAEAVKFYGESITANPKFADAYNNLGNAFQQLNRIKDALNCYNLALDINPSFALAKRNKAGLLWSLGYTNEAELLNTEVLSTQKHQDPDTLNNLGLAYVSNKDFDKAETAYNEGLKLSPKHHELRWNLSHLQLQKCDFINGWRNYQSGFHTQSSIRKKASLNTTPEWNGEALDQKTILLYGEQGIGDEIMFSQFIPSITQQAAVCIIACEPRLAPLFRRSFPTTVVIEGYTESILKTVIKNHNVDFQCTIGSAMQFVAQDAGKFPKFDRYLIPDTGLQKKWEERYRKLEGELNVGISWRGGKELQTQISRSTTLEQWISLLNTHNVNFINLQYGEVANELNEFENRNNIIIHHWNDADPIKDMDNFAAQVAALDLVISIDNSTVHISGALGIPTWTLLPYSADWRWGVEGYNSYWYPSLVLFRQSTPKNWHPVFIEVTARLQHALKTPYPKTYISHTRMPKAVLLNDTSHWYHWGCTCTSTSILQQLSIHGLNIETVPITSIYSATGIPSTPEQFDEPDTFEKFSEENQELINKLKAADIVITNGEGTIHGTSRAAIALLYTTYIAKHFLGKRTAIINHSSYPCDDLKTGTECDYGFYSKTYSGIDYAAVREPISKEVLREIGIDVTQSFDCLPLYVRDFYTKPQTFDSKYIIVTGGVSLTREEITSIAQFVIVMQQNNFTVKILVGAKANPAHDDLEFINTLTSLLPFSPVIINAKSASEWLDTIAGASLLVSGRFHHTIAAAVLQTPYIAFESNTPKISGITEILGLPEPIPAGNDPELMLKIILERTVTALESPALLTIDEGKISELCKLAEANFKCLDGWILERLNQ